MTRRRIPLLSVLALVFGLGVVVFLMPLSAFRGPLEAAASRSLGRDVTIGGSIHLAVFPQFGVALHDVVIANAADGRDPQMIKVGKIIVGAELMPLLSGHLQVTKVILKQPVIHLEVNGNGAGNWQFATTAGPGNTSDSVSLQVERIRIENGEVTYFDAHTGKTKTLSDVDVLLTTPISKTDVRELSLEGTATYNAVAMTYGAKLDDIQAFLNGKRSGFGLSFSSNLFQIGFSGQMDTPGSMTGNLKIDAKSLRQLAAWADEPLPPGNGFGAISIESGIAAKEGVYSLSNAKIALDGMKLAGDLAIDINANVPALKGTLTIDRVNLTPYLAPGTSQDLTAAEAQTTRDTPLALGGLKGLDGDLALTIDGLVLPDFKLDRASIVAKLQAGVLKSELTSIAAYGGTGKGELTVDVTGPVPSLHNVLDMNGIRAERFLGELMDVVRVRASGAVHLDVTSRGQTKAEIIKALNGRVAINFSGGSISGVDLGAVARVLQTASGVLGGALNDAATTEFSSLAATFTIQNGVARTADLRMAGPIEMTGAGTVNLLTHQISFHLSPKARLGIAGVKLADIGIPFIVSGTWDHPNFAPDTANITTGIVGTVTGTTKGIVNAPVGVLKSLLGGH